MLFDLKPQELMHSFESLGVRSADEHFAATIRLDILGRKVALHPLHFGNTGRSLSMRHHRRREIPLRKSFGYSLQVLADLIPSGRIGWVIRLNFDDTTGHSELEMVGCLDLAEAHRHLAVLHHLTVMLSGTFLFVFLLAVRD